MNKKYLLALVFGLMLTFSGYAQSDSNARSESKGSFFFSGGVYNGIFSGGPIVTLPNFEIKRLTPAVIGGFYELPYGPGNAFFGLEAGYSSGSRFGGKGGVDFIPIDLTAAYVLPLANVFYLGPRLKIGALGLLGPEWNKAVLTAGARLDAELRSSGFPVGLFVAGGVDLFPTAPELAILPVIEAGLRFPRGKFTWSGPSDTKSKEPTPAPAAPAPVESVPVALAPAAPPPVTPAPAAPAPTAPAPVAPPPAAPAPATPAPTTPAPVAPPPAAPTPPTPAPVVPAPVEPAPVAPPPATPAPVPVPPATLPPVAPVPAPAPVTPAPVAPVPVITAPAIPAPAAPLSVAPGIPGRNIILENGRQGILNSIYFEPDTAVLIESYRPILEAVGRQLAADPSLKVLLRAYAADFGTSNGRYIVSVDRARFSRDFFAEQYGISPSRFSVEAYGSDRTPIYATDDWESHRCVELILLRD